MGAVTIQQMADRVAALMEERLGLGLHEDLVLLVAELLGETRAVHARAAAGL